MSGLFARCGLAMLSWVSVAAVVSPTLAAAVCAAPGRDGTAFAGDTYYPGLTASGSTVTVGAARVGTNAGTAPIAAGDLLLIVQMQDAAINTSDSLSYGDGSTGRGQTSLNASGKYEFARVASVSGTTITLSQALSNTYTNTDATASVSQRRFQVIRVPQNSSLAAAGISVTSPPAWDGTTGGVLALDVAGTLNMAGVTLDASALGFRGGGGVQNGVVSGVNASNYAATFLGVNQNNLGTFKGEGIAGTPRYVRGTGGGFNGQDLGKSGYLGGLDLARGAPGNAGGGGTQHNSGGGGGSNGGAGGKGGYSYAAYSATNTGGCRALTSGAVTYYACGGDGARDMGGLGGGTVTPSDSVVVMGGGGGAGDNNNADDNLSVAQASGGNGGGLIYVRAQTIAGSGTIRSNGQDGLPAGRDGAGGGGAGGTIALVSASSSVSLSIEAKGGKGGNSGKPLRDSETQGPGGGGGGGSLLLSTGTTVSGFSAGTALAGGASGINTVSGSAGDLTNTYGSVSGAGTTASINFTGGVTTPSACLPALSVTKTTSTPSRTLGSDTTATYTVTVTNSATAGDALGVAISDPLPSPFIYNSAAVAPVYAGGASGPSSLTGSGTTSLSLGTAGGSSANSFTIPAGGSVSLGFTVNLNGAGLGTYQNSASVSYSDPTRTAAGQTASPGGTYVGGGSVAGSNYASGSSTAEDVTLLAAPGVSKSFSPSAVNADGTSAPGTTLTISLTNPNGAPITNLALRDDIAGSMGLTGLGITAVSSDTCKAGGSETTAAGVFQLTGGTLPVAGCQIVLAVSVPVGASTGTKTNTIVGSNVSGSVGGFALPTPANATATLAVYNLAISKSVDKTYALPGDALVYSVKVVNNGATATGSISFSDATPAGASLGNWTCSATAGSNCTASGSGGISTFISLAAGGSATFTINAVVLSNTATGSTVTNTARTTPSGFGSGLSASAQTGVVASTYSVPCSSVIASGTVITAGVNKGKAFVLNADGSVGQALDDLQATTYALGRAPSGLLYYFDNSGAATAQLYYYNPLSGAKGTVSGGSVATGTGSGVARVFTRLGFRQDGTGYAMLGDGTLYSVVPDAAGTSASISPLGSGPIQDQDGVSLSSFGGGDIAFDKGDSMWVVLTDLTTTSATYNQSILFKLDPSKLAGGNLKIATRVGAVTLGGATSTLALNGLAFDGSNAGYVTSNGAVEYAFNLGQVDASGGRSISGAVTGSSTTFYDLASCFYPDFRPAITVVKSVTPSATPAVPGTRLDYTLTVHNGGNAPATNVRLSDPIPANTSYVAGSTALNGAAVADTGPPAGMPFANGALVRSPDASSGAPTYTGAITSVGTGTARDAVVKFSVTVNANLVPANSPIVNTATASFDNPQSGGAALNQASNTTQTPLNLVPAIALSKFVRNIGPNLAAPLASTFSNTTASGNPGDYLEYCVAYSNTGTTEARNLVISDPLAVSYPVGTPPAISVPGVVDGYGTGKGIRLAPGATIIAGTTNATPGGSDLSWTADAGKTTASNLSVTIGTLATGAKGAVCFRVKIP